MRVLIPIVGLAFSGIAFSQQCCDGEPILHDNGVHNGTNGYSDGTLGCWGLDRSILDDFDLVVELAGVVDPDAPAEARALSRAFVGIAFRVQDDPEVFAKLYLRLANGRAEDQLQRNHSTQFESLPTHPWHRLRKEAPGQYESYVDLALAEWTRVKIEVRGTGARLFVGEAPEPVLVVDDDLLEARSGGIGLWVGLATKGYFRNVEIIPVDSP